MDEIADMAELSKGTLYLYYKSKEDLYLAVMMRGMETLYEMCEQVALSDNSVVQKLEKFIEVYGKFYNSHRSFFRMFHFFQTPQFHTQVSEDMKNACSAQSDKLWGLVGKELKKGMEEGSIRSGLDPIEITIILWSSATALMLREDGEGEIWKAMRNIDLAHTVDVSNKLLLESIFTGRGRKEFASIIK
jgi:AcrR family transcriptional regulator